MSESRTVKYHND